METLNEKSGLSTLNKISGLNFITSSTVLLILFRILKIFNNRKKVVDQGYGIDWATAEGLAFGSLLEEGYTNISVYDLQGRVVKELVNEYKDQGNYEIVWNAINVPSGVYFIQMNINSFASTQKVMLIK